MDLYGNEIINRYKKPLFKSRGEVGLKKISGSNDSCGDKIYLYLKIHQGKILEARQECVGCLLSNVSADFLCEQIEGMKLEDVKKITEKQILSLFNLDDYSERSKCVLLSLIVLQKYLV